MLQSRMAKVRRWIARARRCDRVGRQKVVRTSIVLAVSYGAVVSAIPQDSLRQMRAEVARGFGPIGGRSETARLIVDFADVEITFTDNAVMF